MSTLDDTTDLDTATPQFAQWLDGIETVEEDHVFIPIGRQSEAMTALIMQRADLLKDSAADLKRNGDEEGPADERSLGESYTERRDSIDEQIAAQLAIDHPDAPAFRLRGLSDEDYTEVVEEVRTLPEKLRLTRDQVIVESNVRYVARAVVQPEGVTTQDIRILRKRLNQGEWARLLDHVNRLARTDAEATNLPN